MGHEVTRAGSVPQVHSVVGEGEGHWNGDGSVARGGGAEWRGGEDQGRVEGSVTKCGDDCCSKVWFLRVLAGSQVSW